MSVKQSRKWQLTINNPIDKGWNHENIIASLSQIKNITYWCLCDEVGSKEHTLHTHIFIFRQNPLTFSRIKNLFPESHIEAAKGSAKENRDYIRKEGKYENSNKTETNLPDTFEEFGELPQDDNQGKRTDLETLYDLIKEGYTDYEIFEDNPGFIKYASLIKQTRETVLYEKFKSKRRTDLRVEFWYGPPGCGKTSGVLDLYGDDKVYIVSDYLHPWDGYKGQDVVLMDDLDARRIITNDLLKWLDIYPLELPCRFANKVACFTKVFITSNYSPEDLWQEDFRWSRNTYDALMRRIHVIRHLNQDGTFSEQSADGFIQVSQSDLELIDDLFRK